MFNLFIHLGDLPLVPRQVGVGFSTKICSGGGLAAAAWVPLKDSGVPWKAAPGM